jgi:hypothetical protein
MDVQVWHVVPDYGRVHVLGSLYLDERSGECRRQLADEPRLFRAQIGEARDVPLRLDDEVSEIAGTSAAL